MHTPAEPRRTSEIDSVLRAIDLQLRRHRSFLRRTLTDYNLAVADFVLPLFPPDTSAKGSGRQARRRASSRWQLDASVERPSEPGMHESRCA